jgi:hypothetical protein
MLHDEEGVLVTHEIQVIEGEFQAGCDGIRNFCATAGPFFEAAISNAKERHIDGDGVIRGRQSVVPEDYIDERGEEVEVAMEQQGLYEAYELVGLFALIFIASRIELFLRRTAEVCSWLVKKEAGSNLVKTKMVIERNAGFRFDDGPSPFEYISELFRARNDSIHNDGLASADYLKEFTTPRFVKDGAVVFTLDHVADATEQLPKFAEFVAVKCKLFSKPFP